MKPNWLKTRIFLDSGDPEDTRKILNLIGFLDGQTTNPSLVAKNPEVQERLKRGERFTREDLLNFYKKIVQEVSILIPEGSVSIETYADYKTTAHEILEQAKEMFSWIPNAHVKMPTNKAGLEAAERAVVAGIRVNMTLCFSQEQAGAVYTATQNTRRGDVFVSPFIGRLDDIGLMGVDLIENIMRMFCDPIHPCDKHVQVLAASIRHTDHLLHVIRLDTDIATCPFKVLEGWAKEGFSRPGSDFCYNNPGLKKIPYRSYINFDSIWNSFDIAHPLTDKGVELFSRDWNSLVK